MKLKPIGLIFALILTVLAAYIFYVCGASTSGLLIGGICVLATSVMSLAIKASLPRTSLLSVVTSAGALILFCCINIVYACISAGNPTVIITNGILLIIYSLVTYGIWQAKQ